MKRPVLALPLLAIGLFAQPAFEIASIKPTLDSQCTNGSLIGPMTGGGLRVECLPLKNILTWAYDVQDYQVSGGPSWVSSQRWTILAKPAAPEAPQDEPAEYSKMNDAQRSRLMALVRQRTQALLAERFQLTLRHESREQATYALTVAKNGAKFKEASDPSGGYIKSGRGEITGKATQMEALTQYLGAALQRPVADGTNLPGRYDFQLTWTPERPASDTPGAGTASDPTGPTIFTAIEEQLGLRLESRKMAVDTLVIARVEKPSAN
jgi:bla regulator protein blaR1